jgi:hypothetical protein
MRTILCALLIACLAAPAFAQTNLFEPAKKLKTEDEVLGAEKRERDYDKAMKKVPDQNTTKRDPWGNVRGGTAATDDKKPR